MALVIYFCWWLVFLISNLKLMSSLYMAKVPGYEKGNFIGPTILSDVTADMECYKVLVCLSPVFLQSLVTDALPVPL